MTSEFRLGGDLPINRLGFGAMRLPSQSGMGGKPRDLETGRAVLRRALELGVNHIDTADFYRSGDHTAHANTLIREALHPYPDGLVIATKVGLLIRPDGYSVYAPSDMRALVEENLIGLGMNRLDLVYLRVGHMEPPHGESIAARFEALAELREEGLIRHLGLSNVDTGHLTEARAIAPVTAVQNQYHAAHRADVEMLAACEEAGIAFAPFFLSAADVSSTTTAWPRSPPGTGPPSPRSDWPGCWPPRRSLSPSPAPARSVIWRRTWPPNRSCSRTRTSPTLPDQHGAQRADHSARKVPLL